MIKCIVAGSQKITLRENYPNTEFFLVRIFPYSDTYSVAQEPKLTKNVEAATGGVL